MEHLIREYMASHLTSSRALAAQQHGLIENKLCFANLICFSGEITREIDNHEQVEVCYLDFHKAFDSVNHRQLLLKIRNYHLDPTELDWIAEFLSHRIFVVSVGGEQSTVRRLASEVPQVSILKPFISLMSIKNLSLHLCCPYFVFADDIKVADNLTNDILQTKRVKSWL